MSYKLIVEKLRITREKHNIITRDILVKDYCKPLKMSYASIIGYLLSNKYLARIFRGIFYIYSTDERKFGKLETNFYNILKDALEIRGIKNWYFGLKSGLKLNNLTHEYFTREFIISDKIKLKNPLTIMGREIVFKNIKTKLTRFGIIKEPYPYSDTEKTILDLVYFAIYGNLGESGAKNAIIDYVDKCNKTKLREYAKHYPKTAIKLIESIKS